jgi:PAS domain-containing protein
MEPNPDAAPGRTSTPRPPRSRAAYFDGLAARALRAASRPSAPAGALDELSSLVGTILLEFGALERRCHELEASAAAAVRRREDLLSAVPIPCVITDNDSRIIEVNPQALHLLNESVTRMLGHPLPLWMRERPAGYEVSAVISWLGQRADVMVRLAPRERRPREAAVVIQPVEGAPTPLWRWFLLAGVRSPGADESGG